jgi:hypothetical protein
VGVEQADEPERLRGATERDRRGRERARQGGRASDREPERQEDRGCDQKGVLHSCVQAVRQRSHRQLRAARRRRLREHDQADVVDDADCEDDRGRESRDGAREAAHRPCKLRQGEQERFKKLLNGYTREQLVTIKHYLEEAAEITGEAQ